MEIRCTLLVASLGNKGELSTKAILLAEFEQTTLEVDFHVGRLLQIHRHADDALADELLAMSEPSVEVDGSDERFECIASDVAVVALRRIVVLDKFIQTNVLCHFAQRFALNHFAACCRQETFLLIREVAIENVAHHSFQHGIAQIFQAFVVYVLSFFSLVSQRLMHHRLAIDADVVGVEAQDSKKRAIKLLVLAEKQPYRV